MGELIEDLMKTKVPPLAYHHIEEFLTKVCIPFFCFLHSYYRIQYLFLHLYFSKILLWRLEQAILDPTPSQKVHMGIDLLFVDVPKNLRVPRISTSSDFPTWNKRSTSYFEVLFVFTNTNLHDNSVIVFTHTVDPNVSWSIHNWVHMKDFNVAKV